MRMPPFALVGTEDDETTDRLLAQFVPLQVEDLHRPRVRILVHFVLRRLFDWLTRYLFEQRYHLCLQCEHWKRCPREPGWLAQDDNNSVYMVER